MEKASEKIALDLMVILVKDEETGLISATCAQFPEAMAQGNTKDEAISNLAHLIPFVLYDKAQDSYKLFPEKAQYTSAHLKGSLEVYAA